MSPLRLAGWLCLLSGLALSASAEFYRWHDESGAVHFAGELHEVPAEHREAARDAFESAKTAPSINYHDAPEREVREDAPAAAPAALAPPVPECRALQKQVAKKQKVIRTHRGSVDANLRWADDIGKSAFSRRRYEVRAEEEARWLARAEADLERFVEKHRRKGVEPGCLR